MEVNSLVSLLHPLLLVALQQIQLLVVALQQLQVLMVSMLPSQFTHTLTFRNTDTPPTPTPTPSAPSTSDDDDDDGNCPAPSSATSTSVPDPAPSNSGTPPNLDAVSATSATAPAPAPSSSGGFQFQNGLDAQKLNSNFATLNANSPCTGMYILSSTNTMSYLIPLFSYTEPQTACVNGMFAQCVGTQFDLTSCAPTLQCFALPLVNSPGTSITCDTQANALDRFAASGVTGGITG